jgi:hypothetical protein
MKLVFTEAEVAEALQIAPEEFASRRADLESHGFPEPLAGLEGRWSIIDVVNWVNGSIRLQPGEKLARFHSFSGRQYS